MTAELGFDVTSLSVAEFAERGIRLAPHGTRSLVSPSDRRWLTHSEADVRYPRRLEHARTVARQAAGWWAARHGGEIRGMALSRSFPCLGTYRVDPSGAAAQTGPYVVVCDVCGDRFGVQRAEFDEAFGSPPLSPDPPAAEAPPTEEEPW